MKLSGVRPEIAQKYFEILDVSIKLSSNTYKCSKILDLGVKRIRLISYSSEFEAHINKQLNYILRDDDGNYDDTLVIWKYDPENTPGMRDFEQSFKYKEPYIWIDNYNNLIFGYNDKTNTYYYGVKDLEPEEFIKQGHIFVKTIINILKEENTSLAEREVRFARCVSEDANLVSSESGKDKKNIPPHPNPLPASGARE